MKRLKFIFNRQRICRKCGNITIEQTSDGYAKDITVNECADCYDRTFIYQLRRKKEVLKELHVH